MSSESETGLPARNSIAACRSGGQPAAVNSTRLYGQTSWHISQPNTFPPSLPRELLRHGLPRFNGQIGDTLLRIYAVFFQCVCGTCVEAKPARSASVFCRSIRLDVRVQEHHAKKEIRSHSRMNHVCVLSAKRNARLPRQGLLCDGGRVHAEACAHMRIRLAQAFFQSPAALAKDCMVVRPERIPCNAPPSADQGFFCFLISIKCAKNQSGFCSGHDQVRILARGAKFREILHFAVPGRLPDTAGKAPGLPLECARLLCLPDRIQFPWPGETEPPLKLQLPVLP
jgi:hypothetical protein